MENLEKETANVPANKEAGALAMPGGTTFQPKAGLEEGMDSEEIMVPFATLLQASSPDVVQDKGAVRNFQPGMVINSITKKPMPEFFIPIIKYTEWIRFNPRNKQDENFDPAYDAGDVIWRTKNKNDPRVLSEGKFINGEKPLAVRFMTFLCYFPGCNMPVALSFAKTSFRAGKKLLNDLQYSEDVKIFSRKYRLIVKEDKDDVNTWFVFDISYAGAANEQEFALCQKWYNDLKDSVSRIQADIKSDVHESEGAEAPAPARPY